MLQDLNLILHEVANSPLTVPHLRSIEKPSYSRVNPLT